jgi:UDP-N-acetylmuramoyl-tripeptide--D-alanyl-D-alanine ligase
MMLTAAGGIEVIDDCYNANPESMAVALDALALRTARRRLAVLGDMRELGAESASAHRELGERAAPIVDHLYLTGDEAATIAAGARAAGLPAARITIASDRGALAAQVAGDLAPGDVILIKASRALELEHVVEVVLSAAGEEAS